MSANAVAVRRHRVQLRSVNADDLLNRLLARGIAREVSAHHEISRAVRVNSIEVAISEKSAERNMRARWRERVKNKDFSYLRITDDPAPSFRGR